MFTTTPTPSKFTNILLQSFPAIQISKPSSTSNINNKKAVDWTYCLWHVHVTGHYTNRISWMEGSFLKVSGLFPLVIGYYQVKIGASSLLQLYHLHFKIANRVLFANVQACGYRSSRWHMQHLCILPSHQYRSGVLVVQNRLKWQDHFHISNKHR